MLCWCRILPLPASAPTLAPEPPPAWGKIHARAHGGREGQRETNPKSQSPPSTSRSLAYLPRVLLEPVELVYPRGRPLLLLLDLTDLGVAHEAGDVRNGTPQRGLARRRLHPPLLLLLLLLLLLRPGPLLFLLLAWA